MTTTLEGTAATKEITAPEPDDPRKPESPPDLHRRSWVYTARMAFAEFKRDQCADLAAALTFYAVAAVFPAFVVLVALVGLIGQGQNTADALVKLITDLGQDDVARQLRDPITELANARGAGLVFVLGVLGALWSASGYVSAFGRTMNRVYEIDEGRPVWKLRPLNLLVSAILIVGASLLLLGVTMSGSVSREVADRLGLGRQALDVWNVARWPAMLLVLSMMVAVLYYATPNVRQPRFRWMSVGAGLAIVLWVAASLAFGFWVGTFGTYDKTYGSLAGVVVMLLWLWLTNAALLFGAEFDAELERARELEAGIVAEETLQLPPRDTTASKKAAERLDDDIAAGRALRLQAEQPQSTGTSRRTDRSLSAIVLFVAAVVLGRRGRVRSHAR